MLFVHVPWCIVRRAPANRCLSVLRNCYRLLPAIDTDVLLDVLGESWQPSLTYEIQFLVRWTSTIIM